MSTKTTFKRVALVAVASMGFGLLSVVVAPVSSATPREATAITVGTVPTCRTGALCSIPVTFNLPAATVVNTDSFTVVAKVTSAPAASNSYGSAASGSVSAVTSSVPTAANLTWAKPSSGTGSFGTLSAGTFSAAAATSTGNWAHAASYTTGTGDLAGQVTLNFKFNADAAGSYTVLFAAVPVTVSSETAASTSSIATLAGYTASSVTITTGSAPTTVTLTNLGGTAATSVTGSFPIFLPGEIPLIKAEAYARQTTPDLNSALTELNKVITKTTDVFGVGASLTALTGPYTQPQLLELIYKHRCIELFASGLKLEDMRRFGRPVAEMKRRFMPYPFQERDNNPNTPANPTF